jgi:DNA-directed RNA polymerase subunit M|tara:strand:+ start:313 stop:612 length:300 start_codon:yes stop_codon:yes gene_type:complete
MLFCPKCKAIMYPDGDELKCKRCRHSQSKGKSQITSREIEEKKMVVTEGVEGTLPTTKIICPKCKHNEATYYFRQTRAADEPTTRFYQCTDCKNRWREY